MPSPRHYFAAIIGTTVWLRSSMTNTYRTITIHKVGHPKHGEPSWCSDSHGASAVVLLTPDQALILQQAVKARRKRFNLPATPHHSCVNKAAIPPWLFEEIRSAIDIEALMMGKQELV